MALLRTSVLPLYQLDDLVQFAKSYLFFPIKDTYTQRQRHKHRQIDRQIETDRETKIQRESTKRRHTHKGD